MLKVPAAYISFVVKDRQILKSGVGLGDPLKSERETPIGLSLSHSVVVDGRPLVVRDVREDDRLKADPSVEKLGIIAYIGVPIRLANATIVGTLCAIDQVPHEWCDEDVATMDDLASLISREIELRLEVERRHRAEEDILLVARELQHRSRNAFSIVQAVISLSMRDKALLPLKLDIIDRISAVSSSQELISEHPSGTVWFRDLVSRELAPLASKDAYTLDEAEVVIAATDAVFIGMIIHELTTNAVKYGALRVDGVGYLSIQWSAKPEKDHQVLSLVWRETGLEDPDILHSRREDTGGFGSELLDILVSSQLKGQMKRTFTDNALTIDVTLRLALAHPSPVPST